MWFKAAIVLLQALPALYSIIKEFLHLFQESPETKCRLHSVFGEYANRPEARAVSRTCAYLHKKTAPARMK